MVALLIKWSVNNPLIVILATIALAGVGVHAFQNVNVEAYPDPAPPIVEIIAQNRGRSAEEMERLVTVPLEVALSGMPGLKTLRTKSLFVVAYSFCEQISSCVMLPFIVVCNVPKCTQTAPCEGKR